jgi:hypothetical protein
MEKTDMHPLPVEIADAPKLEASLVWGTLERLQGAVGFAWLEEQPVREDKAFLGLQ